MSGSSTPIAYMNTQDVARFAVAALGREQTIGGSYLVVGPRPGTPVKWCCVSAWPAKRPG